jgi:hypothetical protein
MNPFGPNALDHLESIIATCAILQNHPTYLGLYKTVLQKIDDDLDSVLASVNEDIDAHKARNPE